MHKILQEHAALRFPEEAGRHMMTFSGQLLCLCVFSEGAKQDVCLDVCSWSVSNVSLCGDGPSHAPAETRTITSAAAVVHSMHCIKGKESTFCGRAVCSGSGFVPALRAVRTPLKASLKTITLNIIAVVT